MSRKFESIRTIQIPGKLSFAKLCTRILNLIESMAQLHETFGWMGEKFLRLNQQSSADYLRIFFEIIKYYSSSELILTW